MDHEGLSFVLFVLFVVMRFLLPCNAGRYATDFSPPTRMTLSMPKGPCSTPKAA